MSTHPPTVADVGAALTEAGIAHDLIGDPTTVLTGATHDSRRVVPGAVFVCLRGDHHDGHEFAPAAIEAGAAALLVDHALEIGSVPPADAAVCRIVVADTRRAAGVVASVVAGRPSAALATVGITGTNGKTTTAQLLATILDGVGRSTGVIGTLHGKLTTPEATDLQASIAHFRDTGRDAVVMEVSSHALELHRVDGTTFDVVAFTNFGHDHLDLHGTTEAYFRAKSRLFDRSFAPVAVINVDDPHGRLLADAVAANEPPVRVVEVSPAALTDVRVEAGEHRYRWNGADVVVPIGGDFNVVNSVMALSIAEQLGVEPSAAAAAIAGAPVVPGRFERIDAPEAERRGVTVIVDFAHTPDGLEHLLESARAVVGGAGRVIAVFGAGGDRDRPKRPEMGAVVARLADRVVVTSDNPRTEDPVAIIGDVLDGVEPDYRDRTTSDPDRRAAIRTALAEATRGDLVVIAGRGHESTQDLGSEIVEFDDRQVAREVLASLADATPTVTTHEDAT